jgi:hypothetical protein
MPFEAAHALVAGCRRQVYFLRERDVGYASVLLQIFEDQAVSAVKGAWFSGLLSHKCLFVHQ